MPLPPYDLSYLFDETSCGIDFLLKSAQVCYGGDTGAIQRNAMACHRNLALEQAFDDLKELNLLLIGGSQDTIAPPEKMISPCGPS